MGYRSCLDVLRRGICRHACGVPVLGIAAVMLFVAAPAVVFFPLLFMVPLGSTWMVVFNAIKDEELAR